MSTYISPVIKEKLKKEERRRLKQEMRGNLPVLSKREVRRHRIAYHEALCLELEEDQFVNSAHFVRSLIQYQDDVRAKYGPGTSVWNQPQLKDQKEFLERLYEGLREAETGQIEGNRIKECKDMLQLSLYFAREDKVWSWIAEQLFLQCEDIIKGFKEDGGRLESVVQYVYGWFLLTNCRDPDSAREHLEYCKDLADGHPQWKATEELGKPQKSVFVECCRLLYQALLLIAEDVILEDPSKAAKLCYLAKKRAIDACDEEGVAQCLMHYGVCDLARGEAFSSLMSFKKILKMYMKSKNSEGSCETRLKLAEALCRTKKYEEAEERLLEVINFAKQENLTYYIAKGYRYLGEFYMERGKPGDASPLLEHSMQLFHSLNNIEEVEQIRNLAAIAFGQNELPKYANLILLCDNTPMGLDFLMQLVRWKDIRERHWEEMPEENEETITEEVTEEMEADLPESEAAVSSLHSLEISVVNPPELNLEDLHSESSNI